MMWIVLITYIIAMTLITLFSLGQLNLVFHYLKKRQKQILTPIVTSFPYVTIQVPIFNEQYVIPRLLDALAQIEYPREKLEIQILDDSTDETSELIADKIEYYSTIGIQMKQIRRIERKGYKAGALQEGLKQASGEFIAIFDADFIPKPDFLLKTIGCFQAPNIGMVQTRWGHINENYSLLTKLQAFGLNAHFTVEQAGRKAAKSFINFNGTAGIWRKECILDAGGWHHDTLTEDLDLSYRAQLKGWQFEFLEHETCPAELPILVSAIKSQQYRWNKGAAETARKNLKNVLRSSFSWPVKIRAVLHLLNSSVFLYLLLASVLSIPMLYYKSIYPALKLVFEIGSIFLVGFISIGIFYWVSSKAIHPRQTNRYFFLYFPAYLMFSMGLSLHNTIAIIEGLIGKKTPFIRTPKFNVLSKSDGWKENKYLQKDKNPIIIFEGILSAYFLFGVIYGFIIHDFGLLPFHLMLSVGFMGVFFYSIGHRYVTAK